MARSRNEAAVKSMVIHKGAEMTDDELDLAREIFDELSDAVPTDQRVKHWINRSEGHVQRQARFDLGNDFEDSYRLGLSNNVQGAETAEYLALKSRLAASDIGKNLDDYSILSGVQLCIGNPCNKAGNYFIPDFIAVKQEIGVDGLPYWDVIIVDTKLNQTTTPWTKNQITAQGLSEYSVKSVPENGALVTGENIVDDFKNLVQNQNEKIQRNSNFIKVYSDGNGNFSGGGIE